MLPGPAVPGCCFVSFHFLWGKLVSTRTVEELLLCCHACLYILGWGGLYLIEPLYTRKIDTVSSTRAALSALGQWVRYHIGSAIRHPRDWVESCEDGAISPSYTFDCDGRLNAHLARPCLHVCLLVILLCKLSIFNHNERCTRGLTAMQCRESSLQLSVRTVQLSVLLTLDASSVSFFFSPARSLALHWPSRSDTIP